MRVPAVRAHHGGAVIHVACDEGGVGPDGAVRADHGAGLEVGARQDLGIGADPHVRVQVGGGRVVHRDAGELGVAHQPGPQPGGHLGELDAVVDTLGLGGVLGDDAADGPAGGSRELDDVGQVQLTLGVRRGQAAQQLPEQRAVESVDARIDLVQFPRLRIRVAMLHDRRDRPVGAARDAPVSGRVVDVRREHGDCVARPGMFRREGHQCFAA